jgi:hypothetical protein
MTARASSRRSWERLGHDAADVADVRHAGQAVREREQRRGAVAVPATALEGGEQVEGRGRVAGVGGEQPALVVQALLAVGVQGSQPAVPATRGDHVDDDRAGAEVVPVEQPCGKPLDLVDGDARGLHQRRPAVGGVHREQVALRQHAGCGPLGDPLQDLPDVGAGDEVGGRRLQVRQLLAQRGELAVVGPPAERPPVPARPGDAVEAGGGAVGLALLVHQAGGGSPKTSGTVLMSPRA